MGLHLAPEGKELACDPGGRPYDGAEIAVRRITEGKLPGYAVELAMPLKHLPALRGPQAGVRFHFAMRVNDADRKPGEPTKRTAQGYYPQSWVHPMPRTSAAAVLCDAAGVAPLGKRENDRSGVAENGRRISLRDADGRRIASREFPRTMSAERVGEIAGCLQPGLEQLSRIDAQ